MFPLSVLHHRKATWGHGRKESSASQKVGAHQEPNLPAPWSCTCSPRTVRNTCLLFERPSLWNLLQQPKLTKTGPPWPLLTPFHFLCNIWAINAVNVRSAEMVSGDLCFRAGSATNWKEILDKAPSLLSKGKLRMQFLTELYSVWLCRQHSQSEPQATDCAKMLLLHKAEVKGIKGSWGHDEAVAPPIDAPWSVLERDPSTSPHSAEQGPVSDRPLHSLFENVQIASWKPDYSKAVLSDTELQPHSQVKWETSLFPVHPCSRSHL